MNWTPSWRSILNNRIDLDISLEIFFLSLKFITNVYLSGKFSVEFMMKSSGHKKYDTFKKYVRLSLDEYADDIAKSADNCLF